MTKKQKVNLWNKLVSCNVNGFNVLTASINLSEYEQMIRWMDEDGAIDFYRHNNAYVVEIKQEEMPK